MVETTTTMRLDTVNTRKAPPATPATKSSSTDAGWASEIYRGDRPVPRSTTRMPQSDRDGGPFDPPTRLPAARGPLTQVLIASLLGDPHQSLDLRTLRWTGDPADATTDDDLQLALWLTYEQHYCGLAGVNDAWEWHPEVLWARKGWEEQFVAGLRLQVAAGDGPVDDGTAVQEVLDELASPEPGWSLSEFLMRESTSAQFAEFLVHRSLVQLKAADPHTWVVPRLSPSVKAPLTQVLPNEYGGLAMAVRARQFRTLLQDWDLHDTYGYYLDHMPGSTLMAANLISMFGLHRRWRGALVGHLAAVETTAPILNNRYARGHRRLGGGEEAAVFFDEHAVVDSLHDQPVLRDLAVGLAAAEPQLAADIMFGARCAAYTDLALARLLTDRWGIGQSSLRHLLGSSTVA